MIKKLTYMKHLMLSACFMAGFVILCANLGNLIYILAFCVDN